MTMCNFGDMHAFAQTHQPLVCNAYIQIYLRTYILTYTHAYTLTYIGTHTHTHIHPYIDAYRHRYIHRCIHEYIHTYIHTYTPGISQHFWQEHRSPNHESGANTLFCDDARLRNRSNGSDTGTLRGDTFTRTRRKRKRGAERTGNGRERGRERISNSILKLKRGGRKREEADQRRPSKDEGPKRGGQTALPGKDLPKEEEERGGRLWCDSGSARQSEKRGRERRKFLKFYV